MKTGYEITLQDFIRLCTDNPKEVGPSLEAWFGYEIVPDGKSFRLKNVAGVEASPEYTHERIQSDAGRQGSIYRTAMTIWR